MSAPKLYVRTCTRRRCAAVPLAPAPERRGWPVALLVMMLLALVWPAAAYVVSLSILLLVGRDAWRDARRGKAGAP